LKEYIIKGFTMDDERLKNPNNIFGKDYFDEQLASKCQVFCTKNLTYLPITTTFVA